MYITVFFFIWHRLAKDLIQVTQLKAEPWIAMGHFCNVTNRKQRAVYFAQKVAVSRDRGGLPRSLS